MAVRRALAALMWVFAAASGCSDHAEAQERPRLVVQTGHSKPVIDLAVSHDGRLALTGSEDETAILWSLESGRPIRRLQPTSVVPDEGPVQVDLSMDGRLALTVTDTLQLWSAETGKELWRYTDEPLALASAHFFPDGRHLLVQRHGNSEIWRVEGGSAIRVLRHPPQPIDAVALSADSRLVLFGSREGTASLWSVETGKRLHVFRPPRPAAGVDWVNDVAFSPDSASVALATHAGAGIWSLADYAQIRRFVPTSGPLRSEEPILAVRFTPDGDRLLTVSQSLFAASASQAYSIRLWHVATGQELQRFELGAPGGLIAPPIALIDAQTALVASDENAVEIRTLSGTRVRSLRGHALQGPAAVASRDGRFAVIGGWGDPSRLWSLETGGELRRLAPEVNAFFTADGRGLLAWNDAALEVQSIEAGERLRQVPLPRWVEYPLGASELSPDARLIIGSAGESRRLWALADGREVLRLGQTMNPQASVFSSDGHYLVIGSDDGRLRVLSLPDGREQRELRGLEGWITSIDTTRDGQLVLAGSVALTDRRSARTRGGVALWSADSGELVQRFALEVASIRLVHIASGGEVAFVAPDAGKSGLILSPSTGKISYVLSVEEAPIESASFFRDGRYLLTGHQDHTARIWNVADGNELARLISLEDGTWIVVAPDGRFDTNHLETIDALQWVMPDDPTQPLPVEIFMRDYYEPRLLPRLLAGEPMTPLRNVAELNRAQPQVEIVRIEPAPDAPDTVAVTVRVGRGERRVQRHDGTEITETGVHDLRLFRDGQLVAYVPRAHELAAPGSRDEPIARWRETSELALDPQAQTRDFVFEGIRLPRTGFTEQVAFSAYAFNEDRVKSATARRSHRLPPGLAPRRGRAYVIAVGVDRFDNPAWNLTYAAEDARRLLAALGPRLEATGQFDEVVTIALITAAEGVSNATKANIRAVFQRLAGRPGEPHALQAVAGAASLRPATPEDLVLIAFASHGYADAGGVFFLFPHDIGDEAAILDDALLARAVSSDELTAWLRDIDAGELVMIVDACHSAASVEGGGFKPGPMGSRGLGQLAYDKGMRVLAATQADDVALESQQVRQGLLTYALVRDGLEAGQADFQPRDREIRLAEWLEFAARRVPALHGEIVAGALSDFGDPGYTRGVSIVAPDGYAPREQSRHQRPQVFDFATTRRDTVLARLR